MDVSYKSSPLSFGLNPCFSFCTVLDGAKTGKTILPGRYFQDRNSSQYGTQYVPEWKADPDNLVHQHQHPLSREDLPTFVMDVLKAAMDEASNTQLRRIDVQFGALPKQSDADLVAPWHDAEAAAQELLARPEEQAQHVGRARQEALEAIRQHVARVYELSCTPAVLAARANRGIELRQDELHRLSVEFTGGPERAETAVGLLSEVEVARHRASYAYLYDWTRKPGGTRFPWEVAMCELGAIKLRARKEFKPISRDFYEKMLMRRL